MRDADLLPVPFVDDRPVGQILFRRREHEVVEQPRDDARAQHAEEPLLAAARARLEHLLPQAPLLAAVVGDRIQPGAAHHPAGALKAVLDDLRRREVLEADGAPLLDDDDRGRAVLREMDDVLHLLAARLAQHRGYAAAGAHSLCGGGAAEVG
eukprot:gene2398-biopygen5692